MLRLSKELTIGSLCAATALVGSVTYGVTTARAATNTPQAQSATATPQAQALRDQVKPLRASEKQVDEQIKSAVSAWKRNHGNPLKSLSANDQTKLKDLQGQLKALEPQRKDLQAQAQMIKQQMESLIPANQLKSFRQTEQGFKAQIKPITNQIKPLVQQRKATEANIKTDRQGKDTTELQADVQKEIDLDKQMLSLKQQLLTALQSAGK
jgi:predicted  nucleic acid-binding Zn-ribbon protein